MHQSYLLTLHGEKELVPTSGPGQDGQVQQKESVHTLP